MKRILSAFLCTLLISVCAITFVTNAFAANNSNIPGDANGDTVVNAADLTLICRYLINKKETTIYKSNSVLTAPVNDKPRAADLKRLAQYLAGIDTTALVSRYGMPEIPIG